MPRSNQASVPRLLKPAPSRTQKDDPRAATTEARSLGPELCRERRHLREKCSADPPSVQYKREAIPCKYKEVVKTVWSMLEERHWNSKQKQMRST